MRSWRCVSRCGRVARAARPLALLAALLLLTGTAWWFSVKPRTFVPWKEPIGATDQKLRDTAARNSGAADAHRELGEYLLAQDRPYEAIWAFQDAQELQPDDGRARRGIARALIAATCFISSLLVSRLVIDSRWSQTAATALPTE